jgi:hypothetical protein
VAVVRRVTHSGEAEAMAATWGGSEAHPTDDWPLPVAPEF